MLILQMVAKNHQKVTSEGREKRQARVYEPIRILFHNDDTVFTT